MTSRLEHANLHVADLDVMLNFLQTALPDYRIRHDSGYTTAERWVHIGTDESYLALYQASLEARGKRQLYSATPGLNHLAFEVDNAEQLRDRMRSAGYVESTPDGAEHSARMRVYFLDPEGRDWEFVQYFSEDADERNAYDTLVAD